MTRDNLLGKFNQDGESPLPRGQLQADVAAATDANGILNVRAVEKSTSTEHKSTITSDNGRLSSVEFARMVQQAARGGQERYS
jgi:molecular chaperone DnaK (HSP70)